MPPDRAHATGAYCLDGSVPGLWYQPPPTPSAASNRSWLLFLDGGAWCYDIHSCESRARGFKGTTKDIPNVYRVFSFQWSFISINFQITNYPELTFLVSL